MQRLVEVRAGTEGALTSEACAVLSSLRKCVADGERFHEELARQARDETDRRAKSREFHQRFCRLRTLRPSPRFCLSVGNGLLLLAICSLQRMSPQR